MRVELVVVGQESTDPALVTWSPVLGELRPVDFGGAAAVVLLRSGSFGSGRLVFAIEQAGPYTDELQLSVSDGHISSFFFAGKFPHASTDDGDTSIECIDESGAVELGSRLITVRIRKNANSLTEPERDRFLQALALLNDQGMGTFQDFRDMHTAASDPEAHRDHGFLPWHRCYLLDLERELQKLDSFVTLPYWRFDRPAPNLFSTDFIGVPNASGSVQFSASNPLRLWATDGMAGINRVPSFNTSTQPASGVPGFPVIDEPTTIGLGTTFLAFANMEGTPHGAAHVSFSGYISSVPTAAKDPLFFLLHCNVDRLWAKWQWLNDRFDKSLSSTYPSMGSAGSPGARRVGHNLHDTIWPWNGIVTRPRPSTAPRTPFPDSSIVTAPGSTPRVGDLIDFQGFETASECLGFDYDDVPFEPTTP